eukprot:PhF_6_TR19991/c0_g1_i2/m.29169
MLEDAKENFRQTWELLMRRKILFVWMFGAILGNVLQAIFLRKAGIAFQKYSYFLLWGTALPFVLIFGAIFLFLYKTGRVTFDQCSCVSWKQINIMGVLVAFNGIFMVFANSHVPGTLQSLLGPAIVTIPLSMFFSFLYLGRRFRRGQLISAVIIFAGLIVSIIPDIQQENFSNTNPNAIPQIIWDLLFFMGSAPLAMSSVIQEDVFANDDASVSFIMMAFSIPQGIVMFILGPLDMIPAFGSSDKDTFLKNQYDALQCFTGKDLPEACPHCTCSVGPLNYWLFILGYIMANFANVGTVKHGSATLLYIVISITAPVCTLLFSSPDIMLPFLPDRHDDSIWIALVIILIGVVGYMAFEPPPGSHERERLNDPNKIGFSTEHGF